MNGSFLRELRLRKGLDQKTLAVQTGVSEQTIAAVEAGRQTRLWDKTLIALAKGLGVDPVELERQLSGGDGAAPSPAAHVPDSSGAAPQTPHV